MGKSKTNMFEAFRQTAAKSPPVPPRASASCGPDGRPLTAQAPAGERVHASPLSEAARAAATPGVAPVGTPPTAGAASAVRLHGHSATAQHDSAPTAPPPGITLPFSGATFLLLQVVLVAGAYWVGVQSTREAGAQGRGEAGPAGGPGGAVEAGTDSAKLFPTGPRGAAPAAGTGDPRGVRGQSPGAPPQGAGAAAPGPSAPQPVADPFLAAFLDPANEFTLQLVSYDDSPNGRELAQHWLGVLREHQLPAVLRKVGSKLSLFVGASPNALDNEALIARIQAVRDGRGQRVFADPVPRHLREFR